MTPSANSKFALRYTPGRLLVLGLYLIPLFIKNSMTTPFFRDIPEIGFVIDDSYVRPRWRRTFYSAMYELLLNCFVDLSRTRLQPGTKALMFLMIDVIKAMDDTIDEEKKLPPSEFVYHPQFAEKRVRLEKFLQISGHDKEVMTYLKHMFSKLYESYMPELERARQTKSHDDLIRVVQVDSLWLPISMEVLAIYNSTELSKSARDDFYNLGLIGKYADDMVDVVADLDNNRLNLLVSLVSKTPNEAKNLVDAVEHGARLSAKWWEKNCPITFSNYFETIGTYFDLIHSPSIQMACDLVMLPAILGRDYDQQR